MSTIDKLLRPNILGLNPYASARDEYSGEARIWLDANENPYDREGLNRYPDPYQRKLKARIAQLKAVATPNIFLGNGSDEAIDLLIRAFCRPGIDKVLTFTPTYGMYKVSATINDVQVIEVPLDADFQPDTDTAWKHMRDKNVKIAFLCSPNNPTGNLMDSARVMELLQHFEGITVIDEAYIDFAEAESWSLKLAEFPRLVVLQTLSKAYGLAGIRLGMAFAAKEVTGILNRIKPPYNVNALTQQEALRQLEDRRKVQSEVKSILRERQKLSEVLACLPIFTRVYPSDANFVLAISPRAEEVYSRLSAKGVVIRNRSNVLPGALRITVGTPEENDQLIDMLRNF
jgi:histidinol-phosphate aminotransferase